MRNSIPYGLFWSTSLDGRRELFNVVQSIAEHNANTNFRKVDCGSPFCMHALSNKRCAIERKKKVCPSRRSGMAVEFYTTRAAANCKWRNWHILRLGVLCLAWRHLEWCQLMRVVSLPERRVLVMTLLRSTPALLRSSWNRSILSELLRRKSNDNRWYRKTTKGDIRCRRQGGYALSVKLVNKMSGSFKDFTLLRNGKKLMDPESKPNDQKSSRWPSKDWRYRVRFAAERATSRCHRDTSRSMETEYHHSSHSFQQKLEVSVRGPTSTELVTRRCGHKWWYGQGQFYASKEFQMLPCYFTDLPDRVLGATSNDIKGNRESPPVDLNKIFRAHLLP